MNILDLFLLAGVLASAGWGAKKGFIRMLMITVGLVAAIIMAVHYNDTFTGELAGYFHASPLWVTMAAFVLSSMLIFALFRLGAKLFFRVANLQSLGRRDQLGGAFMGVLFGWFLMGYIVFLGLFLPIPYSLQIKLEDSVLALKMGASVPFIYETSERFHPSQGDFMVKMQDALSSAVQTVDNQRKARGARRRLSAVDRARVADFLDRLERYLITSG